jgi:hypothetical protein
MAAGVRMEGNRRKGERKKWWGPHLGRAKWSFHMAINGE